MGPSARGRWFLLLAWSCLCARSQLAGGQSSSADEPRALAESNRERRHARRQSAAAAANLRPPEVLVPPRPHGPADSGARWRIELVKSGRYLYRNGAEVIGTTQFFSLFELRQTRGGAYFIADHAGKWLRVESSASASGGAPSLQAIDYSELDLPGPEDPADWAPTSVKPAPSLFWLKQQARGAYLLQLSADGKRWLGEDSADPRRLVAMAGEAGWFWPKTPSAGANANALFHFHRVVAPTSEREVPPVTPASGLSFNEKVQRVTMQVGGRSVVLATYHNIGMLDWANLFWGWLKASNIDRFFLLELDGVTCQAARNLNCSVQFECATAAEMMLPPELSTIKQATALADWGTTAESAYFKFLRWKLRFVELILIQGSDVLMADADVLILSPRFLPELAQMGPDLIISSDARQGIYDDNVHCPCSHPMYQRYTADWVCAGLFYMRATGAARWFMKEAQRMMDEFTITDQDAIQAVLTGHTQVAIPQEKKRSVNDTRPKAVSSWLKPLWLEGLGATENLRNMRGSQPLNSPMKESLWLRTLEKHRSKNFKWDTMPLDKYGNGPMLVHHWEGRFGRGYDGDDASRAGPFRSIHANCNTKSWLAQDSGRSFLLHPKPLH